MASTTADRPQVSGTATGVGGTFTCGAAQTGYRTFAAAVTAGHHTAGDYIDYVLESADRTTWEVRWGTVGSGGTTLTYTGTRSSSTGSAIDWTGSGTLTCYETVSGARLTSLKINASGNQTLSVASGTITASDPAVAVTQTWNSGGTTFVGADISLTDTASAAASLAFRTQRGGVQQFSIGKAGVVAIGPNNTSPAGLLHVYDATASTGVTRLVVRAGAGQSTTNQQEWQDSSGNVITKISPAGSLTVATGTITASDPALTLSQTFNNGAVQFVASQVNITQTANATNSRAFRVMIDGTETFAIGASITDNDNGSGYINVKGLGTNGCGITFASGAATAKVAFNQSGSLVFNTSGSNYFTAGNSFFRNSSAVALVQVTTASVLIGLSNNNDSGTLSIYDATASTGDTNIRIKDGAARAARLGFTGTGTTNDVAIARSAARKLAITDGSTTLTNYGDLLVRQHYVDQTITAGGTTGAQTINKAAGTVNFAAAATSLVVTNNLVTTSSTIYCSVRTNDATALIKNVVPASGSFTITLNAAATAETSVGFLVVN